MRRLGILAALIALSSSVPAHASLVTYSDRTLWEAAAGTTVNIDFEGIAAPGGLASVPSSLSGVGFESYGNGPGNPPSYLLIVDSAYNNSVCGYPCYDWGSGAVLHGSPAHYQDFGDTGPAGILATLPGSGVFAVGTDLWPILPDNQGGDPEVLVIVTTGSGDSSFLVNTSLLGPPNRGFVGFTSTELITQIRFEPLGPGTEGPYMDLDNFAFAVPEPSTLGLLGIGLVAVGAVRRARRRVS